MRAQFISMDGQEYDQLLGWYILLNSSGVTYSQLSYVYTDTRVPARANVSFNIQHIVPRSVKTRLRVFRLSIDSTQPAQLNSLSRIRTFYMKQASVLYFVVSKNKCADQTALVRRLNYAFVVRIHRVKIFRVVAHYYVNVSLLRFVTLKLWVENRKWRWQYGDIL